MQIVLKAWSSNPDYSTGCDYAVVEGGEAFLKLALRRINVLCEQEIVDPSLNETYYWGLFGSVFQSLGQSTVAVWGGRGSVRHI